ncbi:MAG: hypothetical protein ACKOA8_09585 [Deltaproteobacteria bacterium]
MNRKWVGIFIWFFGSSSTLLAARTVTGSVPEINSLSGYSSPSGIRTPVEFLCLNISSKESQTVTIELFAERIRFNMCVRNEDKLGPSWIKSGDCSYPSEWSPNFQRKQTLGKLAPGKTISGFFDIGCAANTKAGFQCNTKSDGSMWALQDFNSMSGQPTVDQFKKNCGTTRNCVERGEGYYAFDYAVSVAEQAGAVICSLSVKAYLTGARYYSLGQFSGLVNGGRPF